MSRIDAQAIGRHYPAYSKKRGRRGIAMNRHEQEVEQRRHGLEEQVRKLMQLLMTEIVPTSFNLAAKPSGRQVTVQLPAIGMEGVVLMGGHPHIRLIKDLCGPPCRLSQMREEKRSLKISKVRDLNEIRRRYPLPQAT